MQPSASESFFLLDQCLSYRIAYGVSRASGYPVTPVRDEWPERDLSVNPPMDWEIIPHLGAKAGHWGVWITLDWGALMEYAHLIDRHRISVLWLRRTGNRNLTLAEQRRTLIAVLGTAHRIVAATTAPVYLRAMYDGQPMLERWSGTRLGEPGQQWVAVLLA